MNDRSVCSEEHAMTNQFPPHLIETVNRLVRTSRGPTTEELAERLSLPLEKVAKLLDIARRPVKLDVG